MITEVFFKQTLVEIVLAGTVVGAATTFIASLPIPLKIKASSTASPSTVTGEILLYWKTKVNKQ